MEIKDLFVSYEIALKLKEKGFDENCFGIWLERGNRHDVIYVAKQEDAWMAAQNDGILAPLFQQVVDWFREKHNIHLAVDFEYLTNKYDVMFQERTKGRWERYTRYYASTTYNEALTKAIEEALKLI